LSLLPQLRMWDAFASLVFCPLSADVGLYTFTHTVGWKGKKCGKCALQNGDGFVNYGRVFRFCENITYTNNLSFWRVRVSESGNADKCVFKCTKAILILKVNCFQTLGFQQINFKKIFNWFDYYLDHSPKYIKWGTDLLNMSSSQNFGSWFISHNNLFNCSLKL